MLQIRYSPGKHPPGAHPPGGIWSPGEIDISGAAVDLRRLREQVLSFLESSETVLAIGDPGAVFDPNPYERAILTMEVRKTLGPVKVSIASQSTLLVEGTPENIVRFMSWFDVPLDAGQGWHAHFDCIVDSPFVAKDCLDVIVGVR